MHIESFLDEAHELASIRNTRISKFSEDVLRSIYYTFQDALADTVTDHKRLQVSSAPTGSGKSTAAIAFLSYAFKAEGIRSAFLVETQTQADATYRDLVSLLGEENVAVWTQAHDAKEDITDEETLREKGFTPSARFSKYDLPSYPVIVVTHKFYGGKNGHLVTRDRSLFVYDERPSDVAVYDLYIEDFTSFYDHAVETTGPKSKLSETANDLMVFMQGVYDGEAESAPRLIEGIKTDKLEQSLNVFASISADDDLLVRYIGRRWSLERLKSFFGFAESLRNGYAFVSRYYHTQKEGCRFVGYKFDLPLRPGMVLLDATSDLDGISQLSSSRAEARVCPQVNYKNLKLVSVQPPKPLKRQKINNIIISPCLVDQYRSWVVDLVLRNTNEGDEVLVVAPKKIIPHLPRQHSNEWEDREVQFVNWGAGIGSNKWKDCEHVFLVGEFHVPRFSIVATTLGITGEEPSVDRLIDAQEIRSLKGDFLTVREGHLLRWLKQMACRGNVRNIDDDGNCGKMSLYFTGEFSRLLENRTLLFHGCNSFTVDNQDNPESVADRRDKPLARIAEYLLATSKSEVISSELETSLNFRLSKHTATLKSSKAVSLINGIGWSFVAGKKGRGNPAKFTRLAA